MKQSWFGTSSYCSKLGVMYSDNSMEKIIKAKKLDQKNSSKLLAEFSKVNSSLTLHKELNSRVDLYSKELKSYFASVALLENEQFRMQAAALVIQKHIRGFLARLKFSPLLIEVHKRLNSKHMQDLQAKSNYCMYSFGKNLQLATKKIQKAVRRLLFKLKLKKFEQYYESIMFQRDKLKLEKLIKLSFVLFSRFKLNHNRFLRDRERKLKKIRRKVAILLIKKVIGREKIQLKNLRVSIRKYKRRITMGLVHNKHDTEKTNEEDKESNHTEEEIKLARMRKMIELEEAKRKKIKLGKISYKVPKFKYFKLKSRLCRNDSQESEIRLPKVVVNEKNYNNQTTPLQRFTPEPIIKSKFNKYSHLKSNYMAMTESFTSAVQGPIWLSATEQEKPKIHLNKLRNTIYMPTQFSTQKIKEKRVFAKSEKPGWCSNTMVQDYYVPSIFSLDEERTVRVKSERKENEKKWEVKRKNEIRTVFERKFVESLPFTPVSSRFEEALPDLSRLTKLYSRDRMMKGSQNMKSIEKVV